MRTWVLAIGVGGMVVLAGCSGDGSSDAAEVLGEYHDAISAGDVDAAMELVAADAEWGFDEIRFSLDGRVPEPYEGLSAYFELDSDAIGFDIVRVYTEYLVASRAIPAATNCLGEDEVTCTYTVEDALAPVTGSRGFGTIEAAAEDGRLTRYVLVADVAPEEPSENVDAFQRWSALQDPDTLNPFAPVASQAERLLEAYDAWLAAGRPDVEPAVSSDDPVAIAEAWFAANNAGEWETQVSLTGGEALFDPFASREEFEAARTLNRNVTLDSCSVTLETSDEIRIACDVTVTDMVTMAAGVAATNPNQTSMAIGEGRIVSAPQFLPSHFVAEQEIEKWAQREEPENYRRACPEGIAGQSQIIGLSCARFIATYEGHWAPFVADLGLSSSG